MYIHYIHTLILCTYINIIIFDIVGIKIIFYMICKNIVYFKIKNLKVNQFFKTI